MTSTRPCQFVFFLAVTVFQVVMFNAAWAGTGDDFFKGKRLTYIVATKPGGGYDTFARLIARHLVKYLPVQSVVIKNIPGAGQLIGARQLDAAKPDGLTIGTFNTGLIYSQMLDPQALGMDLRRLSWVGKADHEPRVFIVGTNSGIQDFAALKRLKGDILVVSAGKASASNIETAMIAHALGLRLKPVQGFSGTEGELAILRGDLVGMLASYSSIRTFIEEGHGRVMFYVGEKPKELGEVPSLENLASNSEGRTIAQIIATASELGRLTAAPIGIPADRLATLREAYRLTLADPDLRHEADTLKLDLAPQGGEEVRKQIDALVAGASVIKALAIDVP